MTPTATSMNDQRFAGVESQVCSLVCVARMMVFIRKPVVRQMKKPIMKTTAKPTFLAKLMCRREITGIGSAKMRMSVERLKAVYVQLTK